jgi:hypothetical protein
MHRAGSNSGSILGNSVNDYLIMSRVRKDYSLLDRTDRCTYVLAIMIMDFNGAELRLGSSTKQHPICVLS